MNSIVEVKSTERWFIYRRLQELQLSCHCCAYQPLRVQIHDPATAIQLWSVVKQLTAPRSELVAWLEQCWRKRDHSHGHYDFLNEN